MRIGLDKLIVAIVAVGVVGFVGWRVIGDLLKKNVELETRKDKLANERNELAARNQRLEAENRTLQQNALEDHRNRKSVA